jgi:hypothetical protein
MSIKIRHFVFFLAGVFFLALSGCNGNSSDSNATMNLSVTDTPVDGAQSVIVAFTGVELMGPDGQQDHAFASEKSIDLLQQQGSNSAMLLSGLTIPAGDYQWIRLDVDASNSYIITSTGAQYPLNIPSSSQTGLKLVSGFTVAQGDTADFVIDFNLRQSITLSNSGGTPTYMLKPALRLMNMQQVGSISGSVSSTLNIGGILITDTNCSPAVYVYPGTVTLLDGFDVTVSGGAAPITSANVSLNSTTGSYDYMLGFLAPGTYTLAVTCAADDTAGAASLTFSTAQTATVTANTNATIDF